MLVKIFLTSGLALAKNSANNSSLELKYFCMRSALIPAEVKAASISGLIFSIKSNWNVPSCLLAKPLLPPKAQSATCPVSCATVSSVAATLAPLICNPIDVSPDLFFAALPLVPSVKALPC